ncbi:MAG TPA: hypothetical protein VFD14_01980, partial [Clostridia bacterium]|nr:hypothetical protein [Clostridia bacterium]
RHEKADRIVEASAITGQGLPELVERLADFVEESLFSYRARIPYKEAGVVAHARAHGSVLEESYESDHILLVGRIRKSQQGPLLPWIVDD